LNENLEFGFGKNLKAFDFHKDK